MVKVKIDVSTLSIEYWTFVFADAATTAGGPIWSAQRKNPFPQVRGECVCVCVCVLVGVECNSTVFEMCFSFQCRRLFIVFNENHIEDYTEE
jgi:hypothetical protein